jgi:hypothetical protein
VVRCTPDPELDRHCVSAGPQNQYAVDGADGIGKITLYLDLPGLRIDLERKLVKQPLYPVAGMPSSGE